ncbi:MAG TPA: glycosyltransferase family 1 protein [Candidatus Dormibacteraeota bacterium]|jgi:glycosyltransferase involved in cell wall biosynthesis
MRIAIFTETFVPAVNGIVTRLGHTVSRLTARGDQVMLVVPDGGVREFRQAQVVSVPVIPLPMYPDVGIALPHPDVWRKVEAFSPDVIHAVNPVVLGASGIQIARSNGIPLVASYHTHLPRYLGHYAMGFLESIAWDWLRTLHNQAAINLCTSSPIADELMAKGFERVRVAWRGGVDLNLFNPSRMSREMRMRLGGDTDDAILLYVGRLSAEKGLERLRACLEANPGVRLAMVGDGPHRPALERHFAGTRVRFLGRLQGESLAAAYASADVFVFPSETDTFGLVLLEALASGCPVVAARAGGVSDIVRDGQDGILFDPSDIHALPEAAARLARPSAQRQLMRWSGRMRAEGWSWDSAVDDLRANYREAILKRHGKLAA